MASRNDVEGLKAYRAEYYKKNRDKIIARASKYQADNKEKVNAKNKNWRDLNKEKVVASIKKCRDTNTDRIREQRNEWKKANKHLVNESTARRRARKRSATPAWRDLFVIREMYHLAELRTALTGIQWEVDHIVPLRSDLVSGLHCEHNLQIITRAENLAKSNKIWPDMWGESYA